MSVLYLPPVLEYSGPLFSSNPTYWAPNAGKLSHGIIRGERCNEVLEQQGGQPLSGLNPGTASAEAFLLIVTQKVSLASQTNTRSFDLIWELSEGAHYLSNYQPLHNFLVCQKRLAAEVMQRF